MMSDQHPPDEPSDQRPDGSSRRTDEPARPAKRKMVVFTKDVTDQELADALNAMRIESENDDA